MPNEVQESSGCESSTSLDPKLDSFRPIPVGSGKGFQDERYRGVNSILNF